MHNLAAQNQIHEIEEEKKGEDRDADGDEIEDSSESVSEGTDVEDSWDD